MLLFKIVYQGKSTKLSLDENDDYNALLSLIRKEYNNLPNDDKIELLSGFPQQLIIANGKEKITISNGSVITIKEGCNGSISNLIEHNQILEIIEKNIKINQLLIKGYNKEVIESSLELSQGDIGLAETICNDVSIIDNNNNNNNNMNRNIERIIIDADNSCLFNSISYSLCNDKKLAKSFRQLIVNEIKNEKDIYTDDMLGKDVNEYCNWILKDNSWGGEIELNIFSKVLGITINAIEIESNNIYKYENDTSDNCIYLLYDGIHYDSIACSNNMMTIFNKNDTNMINSLKDFAANLKQKREFVNINSKSFEIRCLVCSEVFKGQKEAVSHAQSTGHQNFSQG